MNIRQGFLGAASATFLLVTGMLSAQVPQIVNYQGRVVVGSTNFNGTGEFKFALVNNANGQTLWSNDNTSTNGSEPAAAVSLPVANGLYSVLLGDASIANMTAIPATVFANSDVRLRVWFNDGSHGSQLLTPDQRIASVGYAMIAGTVPDLAISTNKLANNSVTNAKIDSTTVQQRVTGSAAPGTFITAINADGTVVASTPANSGGTVTNVSASSPLSVTNGTTTPNISLGTVPVTNGGTGGSIFAANSLLLGNGTGALSSVGPLTDGQVVIGRTGQAPTTGTLTGTANQINVTNGSGTITLSLASSVGTDISGDLEEESQIRLTNVSNNAVSGQLLLGNGANTAAWASMSGDVVISSSGNTTIQGNAVTLANDTTGAYVRAVSTFNGLAGGNGSIGSEDAVLSLGLDYSATLTSNILATNQTQFASSGVLFEGTNADNFEGLLTTANPMADRTWTLPDATGTVITTGNLGAITSTGELSQLSVSGAVTLGDGAASVQINSPTWGVSTSGNLSTSGLVSTSAGVRANNGTAAAPAYSFLGDTNTGIYAGGSDTLDFSTGGTARLSIKSTGAIWVAGPVVLVAEGQPGTSAVPVTKSFLVLTASAIPVDDFTGGSSGQVLIVLASGNVIINDNNTNSGNIKLQGGNFSMTSDDTLQLVFDGAFWLELGRSVN